MATSDKKGAVDAKARKGLRIVAKREGFRRAGLSFGSAPVDIALDDLTEEQVKSLRSEPVLLVVEIDMPVADAGVADAT